MNITPTLILHEALCITLFYTVFCRAVKTDNKVKTDVRFAFFVLGTVAIMGMVAPIAWAYRPGVFELSLLAAVAMVQIITAHHWSHGVPDRFIKRQYRGQRRRRATDMANTGGQRHA